MKRARNGEGGFTLIELLVVIIILGILAAIVVFAVGGVNEKGQTAACQSDEQILRTAEEAHYANTDPGQYVSQDDTDAADDLVPEYLANPPKYHTATADATGKSYTVAAVGKCA